MRILTPNDLDPMIKQIIPQAGLYEKASRDPSAFVSAVARDNAGNRIRQGVLHEIIQRHITYAWDREQHAVVVGPPDHGKSVQALFRLLWEIGRDANKRVVVVSGSEALARQRLVTMRAEIIANPDLRGVFPKLTQAGGKREARREWAASAFVVQREGTSTDPTIQAVALLGKAEGSRIDILWGDDMVTRADWVSEAARKETFRAWHNTWKNRLGRQGRALFTNNAWDRRDLIHSFREPAMKAYCVLWAGIPDSCDRIDCLVYHASDDYAERVIGKATQERPVKDGDMLTFSLPLWSYKDEKGQELGFSQEGLLALLHENPLAFHRGFGSRAVDAEQMSFPPAELWATYDNPLDIPGFAAVPAFGFMDPAGGQGHGDYCAILVLLAGSDGRLYVFDCVMSQTLTPLDSIKEIFRLHSALAEMPGREGRGFQAFEIEDNAAQALYIPLAAQYATELRRDGGFAWQVPITGKPVSENKYLRIQTLQPDLANGWLVFPSNIRQRWSVLCEQFEGFGPAEGQRPKHDDGPDALASCVALAKSSRLPVKVTVQEPRMFGGGVGRKGW